MVLFLLLLLNRLLHYWQKKKSPSSLKNLKDFLFLGFPIVYFDSQNLDLSSFRALLALFSCEDDWLGLKQITTFKSFRYSFAYSVIEAPFCHCLYGAYSLPRLNVHNQQEEDSG